MTMKMIKKAQGVILLAALFYQTHGMSMELWQKVQQKKFTRWANEHLYQMQALRIADEQITTAEQERRLQVAKWWIEETDAAEEHYPTEIGQIGAVNQCMMGLVLVHFLERQKRQEEFFEEHVSVPEKRGIIKSWLELSPREHTDGTGLVLIGQHLEMIQMRQQEDRQKSQRIRAVNQWMMGLVHVRFLERQKRQQEQASEQIMHKQDCKRIAQELTVQEQGRAFTITQHKYDRMQRQQELRHKQKIKLPRNQKLPKSQRRMQVAHGKKW